MFRQHLLAGAASAALLASFGPAFGQDLDNNLETVTVTAQRLDAARIGIQTQIGASTYTINSEQIQSMPGGDNQALNSIVLQMPSVAQDSFGQLHIRGEHNALQYRIDGIILPEGISVFGQTLDPRLAQSVELITGALPAEYGLDTGGVVDIQTKTGLFDNGGHVSLYGGSHNTLEPSFDYGGSTGHFNYFITGDYDTNSIGIESPDNSHTPEHDRTKQWHGFALLQDIIDENSSVTAILGTSNDMFEIPNQRGLQPTGLDSVVGLGPQDPVSGDNVLQANGQTAFPSDALDERQREITHYATVSYLHSAGALDFSVSAFGRYSSLYYTPGNNIGDILYDGIAQTAYKRDEAYGLQSEGAWHLTDHTIRFGAVYQADDILSNTSSQVLQTADQAVGNPNPNAGCNTAPDPVAGPLTCQISDVPQTVIDNGTKHAWSYSLYAQDEWQLLSNLTINYGLRWDEYGAYSSGSQLSPRANAVWKPFDGATFHLGYSRYFSPPPIELVGTTDIAKFANTTNAPAITQDTTPVAERADYYDAGWTQQITPEFKMGIDGYYKLSRNMIDEGQFGAPVILTPFNYLHGRQYGGELTADYTNGDFTAYGNFSLEHAVGEDWVSSQFSFDPGDFAYVQNHYIHLDHEQYASASAGATYKWMNSVFSWDMIYGTGLREDTDVPNGGHVPAYVSMNLGVSHDFSDMGWDGMSMRADVVNVFDVDYQIRSGSGVGVFAPQYGQRRGFFFGVTKAF